MKFKKFFKFSRFWLNFKFFIIIGNEEFKDFNVNEFDLLNFTDYSLEEISVLLKIILEIEGNFREFHKSQFFDEYFSSQNFENCKVFTNTEIFEKYLLKFNDLEENFKILHSLSNIKEIVTFYDGNLTELFTKFEFLSKELTHKPFIEVKYRFFYENECFSYGTYENNPTHIAFPKELEHKRVKDILGYNKQIEIFVKGSGNILN